MPNKMDKVELRACLEIPWESRFRGEGRMARRAEGGYPQRSPTEKQRSQPAFSAKTLWAAGLLSAACVGSTVTARCGDAPVSPPWPQSKPLAAGPHAISKQALRLSQSEEGLPAGGLHGENILAILNGRCHILCSPRALRVGSGLQGPSNGIIWPRENDGGRNGQRGVGERTSERTLLGD